MLAPAAKPAAKRTIKLKRDMRCRVPGCTNQSKGPRFRYLCEKHQSLPKAEQIKLVKEWAEKHT
jgi:hypothetical protein